MMDITWYIYNYIYLDSPTTLNFWGLSRKIAFFSESTFFEIKYCFLHVSDVHSWRYSWNCGNQINVPHCQLATHCCRCHFCFGCLKVQEQRFPNYWFSFTCLMPWFRSCLLWVLDALCSFIIARMRVGLNTQLRTCGCIAQFWWQLVLGRFAHTTQTCKGLFFFKRTFFCWGPSGRRPKVRKNASKVRKYPSGLDPSEPKGLFSKKRTFFFTSVRPSVKTVSAAGTRRSGRVDVLKPRVYFRISVAMCKCLPPQLIIKSRRRFYISTRIVDPKLFSHEVLVMRLGLNDVWGCLIQHQTGQAQNAHMI